MEVVLIEDDGYFILFDSLEDAVNSIEYADEVLMVFGADGQVFDVHGRSPGTISLCASSGSLDYCTLKELWKNHQRKRSRELPFHRKAREHADLITDIFQVLSLTRREPKEGSWQVQTAKQSRSFKHYGEVVKFCKSLTTDEMDTTIVKDPDGHEYKVSRQRRAVGDFFSHLLFEEQ